MKMSLRLTALASIAVLLVTACSSGASPTPAPTAVTTAAPTAAPATVAPTAAPTAAPTYDPTGLLGKVIAAGKIRISTDPNYKPFSFLNVNTGLYEGFDTATAEETVKRLSAAVGKEIAIEWMTPDWDLITAGSWGGRWDVSIGSMGITKGREKVVDFVDPYFFDFGAVAVPTDSPVQALSELAGKSICVGVASIYEQWLTGTLEIVDPNTQPVPAGVQLTSLKTESECVQAIAAGRKFDAIAASADFLTDAEKQGQPIRVLAGPPTTTTSVAFALDRSGAPTADMLAVLGKIVGEMHADGTLKAISMKWLGKDVTTQP
jgi:polar amino acid transport system substrate-binding protein